MGPSSIETILDPNLISVSVPSSPDFGSRHESIRTYPLRFEESGVPPTFPDPTILDDTKLCTTGEVLSTTFNQGSRCHNCLPLKLSTNLVLRRWEYLPLITRMSSLSPPFKRERLGRRFTPVSQEGRPPISVSYGVPFVCRREWCVG